MIGRARRGQNFSMDCALYYKGFSGAQATEKFHPHRARKELHGFREFSDGILL